MIVQFCIPLIKIKGKNQRIFKRKTMKLLDFPKNKNDHINRFFSFPCISSPLLFKKSLCIFSKNKTELI
jgi:hypothetical protein